MRIKLLEMVNDTPSDSIIETDENLAKELIEGKKAISFSEVEEKAERDAVIKSITIIEKKEDKNMTTELDIQKKWMDDPQLLGKFFQHICGKTITGNAEDSAANGAALVYTGQAALQPLVMLASRVFSKTTKIPIAAGANAMKVPFSISDKIVKGTAPVISEPGEGVAFTATKGQLEAATLTLVKHGATIAITDELLEDAASVDAWVRAELAGKLATVLDTEVLIGSGNGFVGLNGATNYVLTSALSATPTVAEYIKLVNLVHPTLQSGAEWFMSITDWNLAIATFTTSSNLGNQYIDYKSNTLFGRPVNVMPQLNSGDVILANLSKYACITTGEKFAVSTDVRFLEGEVVVKISTRAAGAPVMKRQATGDGLYVSFASEKS